MLPTPIARGRYAPLSLLAAALLTINTAFAQSGSHCPLLGPVFPAPTVALNTSALSCSSALLKKNLQAALSEGQLDAQNVSFHISVFSSQQTILNYGYAAPGLNGSLTSGVLDENTIFRIGSLSKLLTFYTLLAEIGVEHLNDPVTRWVPELAAAVNSTSEQTPVSTAQWEDITLGALASHMAGIGRDLSVQDLSLFTTAVPGLLESLPILPQGDIPTCGTSSVLPPCSREVYFGGLSSLHPVSSSSHTPVYSNIGYQILAYAVEGITKKPFNESFQTALLGPLGLNRTSYELAVTSENAIIPESEQLSWWNTSIGDGSAFGGMFSTASDLTKLGQSILSSSLLPPPITRAWLKPVTHTADIHISVGMPWEIHRMEIPWTSGNSSGSRITDLYSKDGNLGSYSSYFVLSPDHGFGFSVLLAGASAQTAARNTALVLLPELVARIFVPAFENVARSQAQQNFGGTYSAVDKGTNSTVSIIIRADDGRPGLGVTSWTRGTEDMLSLYFQAMTLSTAPPLPSLRLYPMNVTGGNQTAFRGVYESLANNNSVSGIFTGGCMAWGNVDTPQYGNIGFDDFVFDTDEAGRATAITPRVSRLTLSKQV